MADPYARVVGQRAAVEALKAAARAPVHAYLLVGPPGTGTREAAAGFAAQLLCEAGGCGECRHCQLALSEEHPDYVVVERSGASVSIDTIRSIPSLVARSPVESDRKVLLLVDFHLLRHDQYPALLKSLEEPPGSAVIVITAEQVPEHLVTIASRCVRIDFAPLSEPDVAAALTAEGVAPDAAARAAALAGGRLDRARLLASDEGSAARHDLWVSAPSRLDGTGATAAQLADELLASVDSLTGPLAERQARERDELQARVEMTGERGSGRKELDDEHRRELRRVRTDELRFGLAALAREYRRRLVEADGGAGEIEAIEAIQAAGEALLRNPNEALLLQGLLVRLGRITAGGDRPRRRPARTS